MKTQRIKHTLLIALALLLAGALFSAAWAESYTANTMRLLHVEGEVQILDPSGEARFVMENVRFASGETLITGKGSRASVGLDDGRIVTLDEMSRVTFIKQSGAMQLQLAEGGLLLDVSNKLGEGETLDIQTSTMTVGIRGTIVFASAGALETGGAEEGGARQARMIARLGVLEGTAQLSYVDEASGEARQMAVSAGQLATLADTNVNGRAEGAPAIAAIAPADVPVFVADQIQQDPALGGRVNDACSGLTDGLDGDPYAAKGDWSWTGEITIAAQSASKLYDGQPLTRPGDILVYGLPEVFRIDASAGGSQTDAGTGENRIAHYAIFNAAGEDVTDHFANVKTVPGQLVVDPAPLTVWTGSAEKVYDGLPLTELETRIVTSPGYERDEPVWRNASYVSSGAAGGYEAGSGAQAQDAPETQTLYGICGVTWVHGTNPLTGETQEIALYAGQKLTVYLSDLNDEASIEFRIETLTEKQIPGEVLRLYAENPELLERACADTGWDIERVRARIAALPEEERATVQRDDLQMREGEEERLMLNSTNVRINIDSEITNYNGRALDGEEARYTPVAVDESIVVTATGSQTDAGESPNTYEINWGTAAPGNYILSEELGTLVVTPAEAVVSTGSASKPYDGTPLTNAEASITGLAEGESATVTATGSVTNVGTAENTYEIEWDGASAGNYAVAEQLGTLEVTESAAEVVFTAGSAEKVYDGAPLTCADVTVEGLPEGFSFAAEASGSQTEAGTGVNVVASCAIYDADGEDVTAAFPVSTVDGALTVEALELSFDLGGAEATYTGESYAPEATITYGNGPHAGEKAEGVVAGGSVEGEIQAADAVRSMVFQLFTGDEVRLDISGFGVDAGTYTLTAECTCLSGNLTCYAPTFTGQTLTIAPRPLTVTTGSADKKYDGTALESAEASLTGLAAGETAAVAATGSLTDVGTAQNTYAIEWGTAKAGNYAVEEALGTLEVKPNDVAITVTAGSAGKVYDGAALTSDEVTVAGLPGGLSLQAETNGSQTDVGTGGNAIAGYTIYDAAEKDVTAYFTGVTTASGTLTVTPAPLTARTGSADKKYDGTALESAEASLTGLAAGETATITATGSIADVGTAQNTYAIEWGTAKAENYAITEELGTLEVKLNDDPITVTAPSYTWVYNGEAMAMLGGSTVEGLPEGVFIMVTAGGSRKDVGTSPTTVSYYIQDAQGNDVTANFTNITTVNGTLTVTPAPLTVTTDSADKVYDGAPLTAPAHIEGLADADAGEVTVTATGTITDAGTASNPYTIDWGAANSANYTIETEQIGTLRVQKRHFRVTVYAETGRAYEEPVPYKGAWYYLTWSWQQRDDDGNMVNGGYSFGYSQSVNWADGNYEFEWGDRFVLHMTGGGFYPGTYPTTCTPEFTAGDAANYAFEIACKTLTIEKATITVKTETADKVYDGAALTAGVAIEGVPEADAEKISATATGSQTNAGSSQNTYTLDWGTAKSENYIVQEQLGTLTVEPLRVKVDLRGYTIPYSTNVTVPEVEVTVANGPRAGQSVSRSSGAAVMGDMTLDYDLFTGDSFSLRVKGWGEQKAGTHVFDKSLSFTAGSAGNYDFTYENGSITITPVKLTIRTDSAEKTYDGGPLTAPGATAEGLCQGDTVNVTATGSITEVGKAQNTYTIDWLYTDPDNYTLVEELGTLEVLPEPEPSPSLEPEETPDPEPSPSADPEELIEAGWIDETEPPEAPAPQPLPSPVPEGSAATPEPTPAPTAEPTPAPTAGAEAKSGS